MAKEEVICELSWHCHQDGGWFDSELRIVKDEDGKKTVRVGGGYGLSACYFSHCFNEFELLNDPDLSNLPPEGERDDDDVLFCGEGHREDDELTLRHFGFEIK